jgi:hypothetical protein
MNYKNISGNFYIKGNNYKSFQHIKFCFTKNRFFHPFKLSIKYNKNIKDYKLYGELTYLGGELLAIIGFILNNLSDEFFFKNRVKIIRKPYHNYRKSDNLINKVIIEFTDSKTIKELYQFICKSQKLQITFIFTSDNLDGYKFNIDNSDIIYLKEVLEKYFSLIHE